MTSVGWIKYLDIFSIPLWIWTMSTSYFVPEWSMALDDFRWNHSGWEMMSGWHQMNKWDQMLFFYHYVDPDPNSYLVSDWSVLMTMDDYRCNHCGWEMMFGWHQPDGWDHILILYPYINPDPEHSYFVSTGVWQ